MPTLDEDMVPSTTLDLAAVGESLGSSTATTDLPVTMTTVITMTMLEWSADLARLSNQLWNAVSNIITITML